VKSLSLQEGLFYIQMAQFCCQMQGDLHKKMIRALHRQFMDSAGVSTDSRSIAPGQIYFALKGAHFDGNRFAQQVIDKGAQLAIVDDPQLKGKRYCLHVPNVLNALQALARQHRQHFEVPVLAITGSNGKTTTKELIRQVLSQKYDLLATKGNLNNHIGVPLTLLSTKVPKDIFVIEMGANHVGEIELLCQIACPTHGLITNIGKAHLEGFGSLEGVAEAKGELFQYLADHEGTAFINADDAFLRHWTKRFSKAQAVTYGLTTVADFSGKLTRSYPTVAIQYQQGDQSPVLESNLIGGYNAQNLLAAAAVGKHFGISDAQIQAAIPDYVPGNNRSQVLHRDGVTIILDAYNANPTSMKEALNNFKQFPASKKWVILGDMLETGRDSTHEHREVLEQVKALSPEEILLVGAEFASVAKHAPCLHFPDVKTVKQWLDKHPPLSGTAVLVKGSRKIGLERAFL